MHVIAPAEIDSLYPVAEIYDPHADELGHLPYTPEYFVALATAIARQHSRHRAAALTRWSRSIATTRCGPASAARTGRRASRSIRRAARCRSSWRRAAREGMLLALCSKNNEEDVVETFRAHPEMPLRLEDFAARRINWETKGANLAALADELELGLDSFILVDDNPKECNEAQAGAPEVLALPLPADAGGNSRVSAARLGVRPRARHRGGSPPRRTVRSSAPSASRAERSAANLEEFLASLQLEIAIAPMQPAQVARVAQLTQRTNQMNVTLVRRTEAEIQALGRRGAGGRREGPLRQLRTDRRRDLPLRRRTRSWWTRSC